MHSAKKSVKELISLISINVLLDITTFNVKYINITFSWHSTISKIQFELIIGDKKVISKKTT